MAHVSHISYVQLQRTAQHSPTPNTSHHLCFAVQYAQLCPLQLVPVALVRGLMVRPLTRATQGVGPASHDVVMSAITKSCMCGATTMTVKGTPKLHVYCHCSICRRHTFVQSWCCALCTTCWCKLTNVLYVPSQWRRCVGSFFAPRRRYHY